MCMCVCMCMCGTIEGFFLLQYYYLVYEDIASLLEFVNWPQNGWISVFHIIRSLRPLRKLTPLHAVPLSHMCDAAVLTTATVMSPGDGTKVVGINKHCQLTEGITT